uniref:Uncharacterized protein n=1 Tax=Spongospora subterranea TaxID=70186 RepID=A0A0H5RDD2_9EUKA|eukprot:CRZ11756.1 hypothetical protein [Spongospora subterranea]
MRQYMEYSKNLDVTLFFRVIRRRFKNIFNQIFFIFFVEFLIMVLEIHIVNTKAVTLQWLNVRAERRNAPVGRLWTIMGIMKFKCDWSARFSCELVNAQLTRSNLCEIWVIFKNINKRAAASCLAPSESWDLVVILHAMNDAIGHGCAQIT